MRYKSTFSDKLSAVLLMLFSIGMTTGRPAMADTASVVVNASRTLAKLSPIAIGINTATWDSVLHNAEVPHLLRGAGIEVLRWPGGGESDVYHWSPTDIDGFMSVAKKAGDQVIFTVNYGSNRAKTGGGDPQEAAAWVNYANNIKHYGAKYWEIGNEVYGNGEYGAKWETDLHTSHSPTTYGTNCVVFIAAMKREDPAIKCGVVLAAPGAWPDGQKPSWNDGVLAACGTKIDFVILHWYSQLPGKESDSGLLASTKILPGMIAKTKALIKKYCGANASHVKIFITETNSVSSNPGKQTVSLVNALFLADDYMIFLENDADNVDWWDFHNGPSTTNNNSSALYGTANYGDYGVLSSGQAPEPPAETPFPAYNALQMLVPLDRPGDAILAAASDNPLLAVHAVRQTQGGLCLLVINKDPKNSTVAHIAVHGFTPKAQAAIWHYGKDTPEIVKSRITDAAASFHVTVPPYSLTLLVLTPKSGTNK